MSPDKNSCRAQRSPVTGSDLRPGPQRGINSHEPQHFLKDNQFPEAETTSFTDTVNRLKIFFKSSDVLFYIDFKNKTQ